MSNNLNLALRLAYDGKAVTAGAQKNVRDLNNIPGAIRNQVAANNRLSISQQQLMRQQGSMTQSLGLLQRSYASVGATIAAAVSIGTAATFVRDTGAAQLLDQRLKGLTNSAQEYNDVQGYLFETADRLNTKYDTLANSYSKILNLQQVGIVTQTQGKALLEGMANAAAKTGASNVQLEQSLFGITQGMTAGVLRAEELNQVTEPIPGLLQKLDAAAGLASGGFRKLVVDGQVTSQMFKKTLVKALASYAGAAEATQGKINASFSEMSTEYQRLIREYETPVNFAVTAVVDSIRLGMVALRENEPLVESLTTGVTALALVVGGNMVSSLGASTAAFGRDFVAKSRALTADAALAAQNKRSAIQEQQYAVQRHAAAKRQLAMAHNTQLRTVAIKNLAIANTRLAATEQAVAIATNQHAVAATRANSAVRLLRGSMALLGGPAGVALLAAYGIYEFANRADDATEATKRLNEETKKLNPYSSYTKERAQGALLLATGQLKLAKQMSAEAKQRFDNKFLKGTAGDVKAATDEVERLENKVTALRQVLNQKASEPNPKQTQQATPSVLPQNIAQLQLSLLSQEERLKASLENKRQMVIRASATDVANKSKYDAILKQLDKKYNEDVLRLNQQREDEKLRIENTAEEARKNKITIAFENKLAVIKGHSSREAQAVYNNQLRLEQAKQQARIDGARRQSLGLESDDESGELKLNADSEITRQHREQELLDAQGFRTQEEANEAAHQERLFQIKNQYAGAMAQSVVAFANFETKTNANKAKSIVGLGAAAFKQMAGQSKRAFKTYKAFAIAQAVINTYQSATGAFNSLAAIPVVGTVLGGIAAAAAVASGLAQVRQIKSAQPAGIAHGGLDYVPNESTYILQRGERVLSPKQNVEISTAARRINQSTQQSAGQSISFTITNEITVNGNSDEQQSNQVGESIGRQVESYIVENIQSNGSIIRAIRAA